MIRKMIPPLLILAGFVGGAFGGDMLRGGGPSPQAPHEAAADAEPGHAPAPGAHGEAAPAYDPAREGHGGGGSEGGTQPTAWYKFPEQFFVPVLRDGQLDSTMVLSLSTEMPGSASDKVFSHEIKLRDTLLRQLLIQANTGAFDGNFTAEGKLQALRATLLASARQVVPEISDILIGDIARQER